MFLAKYCETLVAVKMLGQGSAKLGPSASLQQAHVLRQLQKEASIMARLRHPNVCQYLGACLDPPCLMMEVGGWVGGRVGGCFGWQGVNQRRRG